MGLAVPAEPVADPGDGWRGILACGQVGRGAEESGLHGGAQANR